MHTVSINKKWGCERGVGGYLFRHRVESWDARVVIDMIMIQHIMGGMLDHDLIEGTP